MAKQFVHYTSTPVYIISQPLKNIEGKKTEFLRMCDEGKRLVIELYPHLKKMNFIIVPQDRVHPHHRDVPAHPVRENQPGPPDQLRQAHPQQQGLPDKVRCTFC